MWLYDLLAGLPRVIAVSDAHRITISHITSDSRQVAPGALFVAYRGISADLHRFIPDAIARGAVAVVGEQPLTGLPVPYVQVPDGREALAWLSAAWYGQPSRSMALVGITGTDGKTTTANILYCILRAAGKRAGLISTVNAVIGDRTYDTGLHTTTPDAPDVQRYLAQMRDAGTEVAVLEATSHGLAQHRVTGCAFDVAVVTNVTHEHLDFHGTYEAYRDAKALLFRSLTQTFEVSETSKVSGSKIPGRLPKTAVLNRDDSSFEFLAAIPAERVITYGIADSKTQNAKRKTQNALALTAAAIHHTPAGVEFDIQIAAGNLQSAIHNLQLHTSLVGAFNISNILAAVGAALALGIEPAAIQAGVRAMAGVLGRMERIDRGQSFTAIVDFAHTPNALARALEAVRPSVAPGGRLIVVFGSAGLRDREKRRLMGAEAARGADYTVITAEDPRTEDLAAIMAESAAALTAAGRVEGQDFVCVADRQAALLHAVRLAQPGDVVIACGKGHEQSMCFGATEHPWRDQDAFAWALDTLRGVASPPPFVLPTWTVDGPTSNL
ncbi:MAG: UDP-N-acetylmuramoyl-L-alanyl-D-glutamate--2,6-diaminopimelate ligase [Chloroflexi bacterium]|nr:UDP-N-acetylmuramoyl-L-alanyl-D-glutamate--2,6-diaminopimelate ligase [Chloroflexota bacterium]